MGMKETPKRRRGRPDATVERIQVRVYMLPEEVAAVDEARGKTRSRSEWIREAALSVARLSRGGDDD